MIFLKKCFSTIILKLIYWHSIFLGVFINQSNEGINQILRQVIQTTINLFLYFFTISVFFLCFLKYSENVRIQHTLYCVKPTLDRCRNSNYNVLPGTTSGGTINDIHDTTTKSPLGRQVCSKTGVRRRVRLIQNHEKIIG